MFMIRKAEYEADAYAVTFGHAKGLKEGLIKLYKHNKGSLVVDPLYSALNNSHPTLIERLQAVDSLTKKDE
jgi:STE24 endopeptidase